MTELELAKAIRDLHGVEPTYVRSEPIREPFQGETVWEDVVEIFSIRGHPKAGIAYAWSHESDNAGRRYVAGLGVPPIHRAIDAVRAEAKQRSGSG